MQMVRTTLRIDKELMKTAKRIALEKDETLQNIFNQALSDFIKNKAKKKAKKIVFETVDLGIPFDDLTRNNYYN
jgi:hypothetical protein